MFVSANLRSLSGRITYLPASDAPLSADVFFIETDSCVYVYDVGSCEEARSYIAAAGREKELVVVLSHFHADHTGNIGAVPFKALYAGRETLKHVGSGNVVEGECLLDASVPIRLIPLPSSHAKDCVALCYGREYAFLGDALYAAGKRFAAEPAGSGKTAGGRENGGASGDAGYVVKMVYNVQKLQAMIAVLKKLDVTYLVLSHEQNPVRPRDKVIRFLEAVYQRREKDSAFLVLERHEQKGGENEREN